MPIRVSPCAMCDLYAEEHDDQGACLFSPDTAYTPYPPCPTCYGEGTVYRHHYPGSWGTWDPCVDCGGDGYVH